MIKLKAEQLLSAFEVLADEKHAPSVFRASERIRLHVLALEAEVVQARDDGLVEAVVLLSDLARAALNTERTKAMGDAALAIAAMRALKPKPAQETICSCADPECKLECPVHERPAQEPPRDMSRDCTCLGSCRGEDGLGQGWKCVLGRAPVETASEENGLLPKKRRREHEYGEDKPARFGTWAAYCVRPGCDAHRVKDRTRKDTHFCQRDGARPTDEPGPCEGETLR